MKIDDIVYVCDGSYCMILNKGVLDYLGGYALRGRRFRILATGGTYPNDVSNPDSGDNNIMAVDVNDPDFVLFNQERFCREVFDESVSPSSTIEVEVPIPPNTKRIVLILP